MPDCEHFLDENGQYLQSRLPLSSGRDLKKCVKLINEAHFGGKVTLGEIHDKVRARGSHVAANAFIDGVGDIVLLNKVHPNAYKISTLSKSNLTVYGGTSFGWSLVKDADNFMAEYWHV